MRFALMCFALLAVATKAYQLGAVPRLVARRRGALIVLQQPAPDAAKASLGKVSDYAMKWIGKGATTPSQTHELVASPSGDHVWVSSQFCSGLSDSQLAKVDVNDPTKQKIFKFESTDKLLFPGDGERFQADGVFKGDLKGYEQFKNDKTKVQPHTMDFDYTGKMWIGLELPGVMIQLDVDKLSKKEQQNRTHSTEPYTLITKSDLVSVCIVNLAAAGVPGGWLKTRPHGFCFGAVDEGQISSDYIWFTGKLTNTVGRVRIVDSKCGKFKAGKLEHFMLPTLGAVPIYLMLGPYLGPDKPQDVWGTCLQNNNVFRVTTRKRDGLLVGHVTEIPITPKAADRRPIAIKPQVINGKPNMPYMWFSCEAGHSIARIDIDEVQELVKAKRKAQNQGKLPSGDDGRCMCSKSLYSAGTFNKAVLEFDVPMTQPNMKLAGLAFDKGGNLWTQSYCDTKPADTKPAVRDCIIKIDKAILNASSDPDGRAQKLSNSNVPITYFDLPIRGSIMHRIIAPGTERSKLKSVWFTELGTDRIGTVELSKKRKGSIKFWKKRKGTTRIKFSKKRKA